MNLAPYATFGRLRLAHWCPNEEFLEDADSRYRLIQEGMRGITFLRSMETPDETFSIQLDLFDCYKDLHLEILKLIELPLEAGCSLAKAKVLLGDPELVKSSRLNRMSWVEFRSDSPEPYLIVCHFSDERGLENVSVNRLDIPFPESQDDLDSPPSEHRRLDPFEVLPENVSSPESPIGRVSVNMKSSETFWYRIHFRPQNGITFVGAALHIRRPGSRATTTTIWLRPPVVDGNGHMELDGYLDKDLIRLAHVRIALRDEARNTSQDVIVEFDQFWGKPPPSLS